MRKTERSRPTFKLTLVQFILWCGNAVHTEKNKYCRIDPPRRGGDLAPSLGGRKKFSRKKISE